MAEGFEFSFDGLEELQRDLEKAVQKAPAQAEKTLIELAKEFKKSSKRQSTVTDGYRPIL